MTPGPIGFVEALSIGTVEFVSPDEIKVLLYIDAPSSVALNTGTPCRFPQVNSYVIVPNDEGFVVGQVEWLAVERSPYPKRDGMRDFGLVDLPYPSRRMSLNPLGTLRRVSDSKSGHKYRFERGVNAFPSIGDTVLLPTQRQLHSIVASGRNRRVKIGTSPLAGNADVYVDPDRLFGRHLAVLGNTGSGKSCSVAGLIRWSLEAAAERSQAPNARFIVLDPNGEYAKAFGRDSSGSNSRVFRVEKTGTEKLLQVPIWLWNTDEWTCFTQASEKTQRPILQQALRLRRNAAQAGKSNITREHLISFLSGMLSVIDQSIRDFIPFSTGQFAKYRGFIDTIDKARRSVSTFLRELPEAVDLVTPVYDCLDNLVTVKSKNGGKYDAALEYDDISELRAVILSALQSMGAHAGPSLPLHEDTPIPFLGEAFLQDLDFLASNGGNRQWLDSFIARTRTMLTDVRLKCIAGDAASITLDEWLVDYVGSNYAENGSLAIIDLSLVPSDLIHVIAAVVARVVFEALQRYRRLSDSYRVLPTVLVMEEAHTFVKRYREDEDNQNAASVCCRVFERIAREGRKFGLGLVLSSQRPSELSPAVISQCNTFLLHRISNDRDQDLVHRFVPDNLRGLLRELPTLPSQNAILLGWASELPILVHMNDLSEDQRPQSDDPDFWSVWTGEVERRVDWKHIADDWQELRSPNWNRSDDERSYDS